MREKCYSSPLILSLFDSCINWLPSQDILFKSQTLKRTKNKSQKSGVGEQFRISGILSQTDFL